MSLVASLMITREWSDWYNGWYWWSQSVYVVPEYRREGMIFQQISIIPITNEYQNSLTVAYTRNFVVLESFTMFAS